MTWEQVKEMLGLFLAVCAIPAMPVESWCCHHIPACEDCIEHDTMLHMST